MSFFDSILWPIMVAVSWIMVQFHSLLTAMGLDTDSGASWVLSIVGLVIIMRIVLIPLFVKQIKASRGMQVIQPEIKKLQAKYKGKTDPASRQAMQAEMMALYREAGTNPFASCLPILAQSPIFFALFRTLYSLPQIADGTYVRDSIGPLTQELAASAEQSTLFGAPLSSTFIRAGEYPEIAGNIRAVTIVLIILMSVTTFTTMRQLTMKNMPDSALDNPVARQQRVLMYVLPGIFAVTGVNFPIGVLLYWLTTNLWSMGQQFVVIRRMPTPGSAADAAFQERRAKRAARRGRPIGDGEPTSPAEEAPPAQEKPAGGQRAQPRRKDRSRPGQPGGNRPQGQRPAQPQQPGKGQPQGQGQGHGQARRNRGAPSAEAARAATAAREAAEQADSGTSPEQGKASNTRSTPPAADAKKKGKRSPGSGAGGASGS